MVRRAMVAIAFLLFAVSARAQDGGKGALAAYALTLGSIARSPLGKAPTDHNPLIAQRYSADPSAIEYRGVVYVYTTGDLQEYDSAGKFANNSYSKVKTVNIFSSADLVNWTDHAAIKAAGPDGAASWADNSWAPAIAMKEIDGKPSFFLYFANGASGIGVLRADHPAGPFSDPIRAPLLSRRTPGCADVPWLFDPAILIDDDGRAYLYFGGGVPPGKDEHPKSARVVELRPDMVSLSGTPRTIDAPWFFEDGGINKIGDAYIYSYCANWADRSGAVNSETPDKAAIVQMRGNSPLGPFGYVGPILRNPGHYFGGWGNNHHAILEMRGGWYVFYHSFILQDSLGRGGGYRSVHADRVEIDADGTFKMIAASRRGLSQEGRLDPYRETSAGTMAFWGGDFETICAPSVDGLKTGDWIGVAGVDFGIPGSDAIKVWASAKSAGNIIAVYVDGLQGACVGWMEIPPVAVGEYPEITARLQKISGVHDLYFVAGGAGISFKSWRFERTSGK